MDRPDWIDQYLAATSPNFSPRLICAEVVERGGWGLRLHVLLVESVRYTLLTNGIFPCSFSFPPINDLLNGAL